MTHCIHLKPGDPGFEAAAAQVTPLHKIRKGFSQQRNNITADLAASPRRRHKENVNELRG